jgi:hypothetical protein
MRAIPGSTTGRSRVAPPIRFYSIAITSPSRRLMPSSKHPGCSRGRKKPSEFIPGLTMDIHPLPQKSFSGTNVGNRVKPEKVEH